MKKVIILAMTMCILSASISRQGIEHLLMQEKILSKEAFNAYLSGSDINRYLKEMKDINRHIMKMSYKSDIKNIIKYIDMEIDRINLTYDKDSLLRLQKEIEESRKYISMLIKE